MPITLISEAHTRIKQRHSSVPIEKLAATSLVPADPEKNTSGAVGKGQHCIEALEPDAHGVGALAPI
jgi:hypothetical protein